MIFAINFRLYTQNPIKTHLIERKNDMILCCEMIKMVSWIRFKISHEIKPDFKGFFCHALIRKLKTEKNQLLHITRFYTCLFIP